MLDAIKKRDEIIEVGIQKRRAAEAKEKSVKGARRLQENKRAKLNQDKVGLRVGTNQVESTESHCRDYQHKGIYRHLS